MVISRPNFATAAARLRSHADDARRSITLTRVAAEDALAATRAALALNDAREVMRFPSNPLMRAMHDATALVTRDAVARMDETATRNGHADLTALFTALIDASEGLLHWSDAASRAAAFASESETAPFFAAMDEHGAPCFDGARDVAFVIADARRWLDSISETGRRAIPSSTLLRSCDDLTAALAALRAWRHRIDRMSAALLAIA
jgi:hypothetical protein